MHPGFLTLQVSFEMTHRGTRGLKLYCCSSQKTGTGGLGPGAAAGATLGELTVHRTLRDTATGSINKYKRGGAYTSTSQAAGSEIAVCGRGWLTTL